MEEFIKCGIILFAVNEFTNEELVRHHASRLDHKVKVLFIKIIEGRSAAVQVRLQEHQRTGEKRIAGIKDEFLIPALYINGQRIKDHEQQYTHNGVREYV